MDVMKLATQLLTEQLGGDASNSSAETALSGLLGDGQGGLDIGSIVSSLGGSGLAGLVGTWLGDGDNQGIDIAQLVELFGGDKLATFAQSLGVGQDQASHGLAGMLPKLIDQNSKGGDLLSSVGGLGGALDMAKKLF